MTLYLATSYYLATAYRNGVSQRRIAAMGSERSGVLSSFRHHACRGDRVSAEQTFLNREQKQKDANCIERRAGESRPVHRFSVNSSLPIKTRFLRNETPILKLFSGMSKHQSGLEFAPIANSILSVRFPPSPPSAVVCRVAALPSCVSALRQRGIVAIAVPSPASQTPATAPAAHPSAAGRRSRRTAPPAPGRSP